MITKKVRNVNKTDKKLAGLHRSLITTRTHPHRKIRSMPQYTTHSGRTQTYRIGEGYKVKTVEKVMNTN